ncbi:uncharacterized protein E6C27_scaffold518G00410 [Cucumis melo var. makuwa]|nr:uncharacterized protein E6C27_scaffold518G00410 [Cucumis melo var. makuwa]
MLNDLQASIEHEEEIEELRLDDEIPMNVETIHACKYNCILYWKEFADLQHCPTCGEARYKEGSVDMRWNRDKRVETDDVLRHPADVEGGNTLILNILILLLIHGICVWAWLQIGQFFQLYAALLWTINDFPTYVDLLGWSTKGYQTCPICMSDRSSFGIRGRISFMGHRRYLLENHLWHRSRLHDGMVERRAPPVVMNGHEILEQLDQLEFPIMIMHIEKNVCNNLVGTLLDIEGKMKNTTNARLDLQDLKIRKDLYVVEVGNRLVKPHASYTLTSSERVVLQVPEIKSNAGTPVPAIVEGSQPLSKDEMCDQVLGRRPDYSKGLGWGPKPKACKTMIASDSTTSCSQSATEGEI